MFNSSRFAAVVGAFFAFLSTAATAGFVAPPNAVPEPGTWALVGLAAAIGFVVTRNKRK